MQATADFLVDHEGLKLLDLAKTWTLEWYVVVNASTPMPRMQPSVVPLRKFSQASCSLWPPPAPGRRGRGGEPTPWSVVAAINTMMEEVDDEAHEDLPEQEDLPDVDVELEDRFAAEALGEETAADALLLGQNLAVEEGNAASGSGDLALVEEGSAPADDAVDAEAAQRPGASAAPDLEDNAPAVPLAKARGGVGVRMTADTTVTLPGQGTMSFYASKNSFQAVCHNPASWPLCTQPHQPRTSSTGANSGWTSCGLFGSLAWSGQQHSQQG